MKHRVKLWKLFEEKSENVSVARYMSDCVEVDNGPRTGCGVSRVKPLALILDTFGI